MTTSATPGGAAPVLSDERPRTPGATWTIYRLLLRSQVTRARLIALGALGAVGIVVGAAIGHGATFEHLHRGSRFINGFGLYLLVPVASLVFASAALGDPTEDGSLVYLWLRPIPRWRIVAAAAASSFTVTWPVVMVPLTIAAVATRAGSTLVLGTLAGGTVSMVGYIGVFVALGLRVKRALVWGLLYIFIWEGFVATANTTAARLAIRAYGRSTLSAITGQYLSPTNVVGNISAPWRWIVPAVVAVVALAYASRRLRRQDVA
jgi:ABC-2 type transport system permease protein